MTNMEGGVLAIECTECGYELNSVEFLNQFRKEEREIILQNFKDEFLNFMKNHISGH